MKIARFAKVSLEQFESDAAFLLHFGEQVGVLLAVKRDLQNVIGWHAFRQQPILEQMAEQIALPAAADARDDLDLTVPAPGKQTIDIQFAFDLRHDCFLRNFSTFSQIRSKRL